MSSFDEDDIPLKRIKKGIINADKYKRNNIKMAKVAGKEHINWAGKTIPAKEPASTVCSCKENCLKIYTEDDMVDIFPKLHDMETKTQKDICLQPLIEVSPVYRQRPRPGSSSAKPKSFIVKYHIMHKGVRTKVCKNGFMKSYGCTSKQCYTLSHLLQQVKTPVDKRGKNVSGNAILGSVIIRLRGHIEQYPTETEHYTRRDKEYLPANLDVKTMYEMFIKKEKEFLLNTFGSEKRLSYKFYWQYFKENYTLGFGQPVKDACVTCEEFKLKNKKCFS